MARWRTPLVSAAHIDDMVQQALFDIERICDHLDAFLPADTLYPQSHSALYDLNRASEKEIDTLLASTQANVLVREAFHRFRNLSTADLTLALDVAAQRP